MLKHNHKKKNKRSKKPLWLSLLALCLMPVASCSGADIQGLFENYLWENRLVIIASPARDNNLYEEQVKKLNAHIEALEERDIVQWYIIHHEAVILNGEQLPHLGTPPFYKALDMDPEDFTFILIGKDGTEKLRKHDIVEMETLFALIDSMPMRQREMRQE